MRMSIIALLLSVATPALADDNPRKLAEDGWRAYQKHDLDRAEKLTRQAIAAASDSEVKAPALYNLGRVLEDRNDKAGAIAAYRESLAARRNATVRDRLATLDATAAASFEAFTPRPMNGPFANLEGYCKKSVANEAADQQAELLRLCLDGALPLKPKQAFKPASPVQELALVVHSQGYGLVELKLGGQLYVAEVQPFAQSGHCREPRLIFDGVTAHGAALEVAYEYGGECNNRDGAWSWHERSSIIVGVGASKKPSATPALHVELTETTNGKKTLNHVRKLTWGKEGTLDVAIAKAAGDPTEESIADTEDIKGHHALAFP